MYYPYYASLEGMTSYCSLMSRLGLCPEAHCDALFPEAKSQFYLCQPKSCTVYSGQAISNCPLSRCKRVNIDDSPLCITNKLEMDVDAMKVAGIDVKKWKNSDEFVNLIIKEDWYEMISKEEYCKKGQCYKLEIAEENWNTILTKEEATLIALSNLIETIYRNPAPDLETIEKLNSMKNFTAEITKGIGIGMWYWTIKTKDYLPGEVIGDSLKEFKCRSDFTGRVQILTGFLGMACSNTNMAFW